MQILAIDGSTKSTGWAILDNFKLVEYGCITASSSDLTNRIYKMRDEIDKILQRYPNIKKVIMEEVRPEQGLQNIKTHKALMYLQACFSFLFHDKYNNLSIEYLYPSEWRKLCGIKTGNGIRRESLKPADIEFVKKQFNIQVNDDIADAIGIGYGYVKKFEDELTGFNWT